MRYDPGTWEMARRIVALRGSKAMHGACDLAQHAAVYHESDRHDRIVEMVHAMDFLLSDEGNGTVH